MDSGATYSALGVVQLTEFCKGTSWKAHLGPSPDSIKATPYWIYGPEEHASAPRRIFGSVLLRVLCGDQAIDLNHLVSEGSTQWVFGGNVFSNHQ